MALIIMGSSGGRCDRSGSALPDITMHADGGARGASRVSAAINMGRRKALGDQPAGAFEQKSSLVSFTGNFRFGSLAIYTGRRHWIVDQTLG